MNGISELNTLKKKIENISTIINQIKVLKVLLLIGHCHLCMYVRRLYITRKDPESTLLRFTITYFG